MSNSSMHDQQGGLEPTEQFFLETLSEFHNVKMPLPTQLQITAKKNNEDWPPQCFKYARLIGQLEKLAGNTCTRPDTLFAVSFLGIARYSTNPSCSYAKMAIRVLAFVSKTSNLGITF